MRSSYIFQKLLTCSKTTKIINCMSSIGRVSLAKLSQNILIRFIKNICEHPFGHHPSHECHCKTQPWQTCPKYSHYVQQKYLLAWIWSSSLAWVALEESALPNFQKIYSLGSLKIFVSIHLVIIPPMSSIGRLSLDKLAQHIFISFNKNICEHEFGHQHLKKTMFLKPILKINQIQHVLGCNLAYKKILVNIFRNFLFEFVHHPSHE